MFSSISKMILFFMCLGQLSHAQFSNERIALGTLKGGYELKGVTPSGFNYKIEFLQAADNSLVVDAFVTTSTKKPLTDYMQRFEMSLKETNESFPKYDTPEDQRPSYFSKDGAIYLVTNEKTMSQNNFNLIFIELNKSKQVRVTLHYRAKKDYRANGHFTEEAVKKSRDPKAGETVVTTPWINVQ